MQEHAYASVCKGARGSTCLVKGPRPSYAEFPTLYPPSHHTRTCWNSTPGLVDELKAKDKALAELRSALAAAKANELFTKSVACPAGGLLLVERLDGVDGKAMQDAAEGLQKRLGDAAAVVLGGSPEEGKVSLVAAFGPAAVARGQQAGKVIGAVAKLCGGGGGGRPNLAQAGGKDASKIDEALEAARAQLADAL